MLTELRVEGFKAWRDTRPIRLAPITAFFGANSSGKTSLLQFLLMLKQTAASSDRTQVFELGGERSLVELGTYDDILFREGRHVKRDPNKPSDELRWSISWTLPGPLRIADPERRSTLFEGSDVRFDAEVRRLPDGPAVYS
jgi:AAA ATPase domain